MNGAEDARQVSARRRHVEEELRGHGSGHYAAGLPERDVAGLWCNIAQLGFAGAVARTNRANRCSRRLDWLRRRWGLCELERPYERSARGRAPDSRWAVRESSRRCDRHWRDLRLRGCGWRHQRAGGGADLSTQGWRREDLPCARQSSHLWRRGQTQRVSDGWPAADRASGFSTFLARFYESIGLKTQRLEYQKWAGPAPEIALERTPYLGSAPYGLYFGPKFGGPKFGQPRGVWVTDPWGKKLEGAPISAKTREELLRHQSPDKPAQKPEYRGDAISRRLDTITLEDHLMETYSISRETVRTFLSPDEGGGYGLGPDALSGYTAYAFDELGPIPEEGTQMFPDGNSGIARLIVKALIPESIAGSPAIEDVCRNGLNFAALDHAGAAARIRLDSTVVWAKHDGDPAKSESVTIAYTRGGKTYRVKARSVVMAGGSWTTKHVVRDLPADRKEAYSQFYRSPCMVANVAVRNWRFLYKLGISGCQWFEGLGSYMQVRKLALCGTESPTIGPDSPVVLTIKVLYTYPGKTAEQQGHMGRGEMISTPFREYERQIRRQLTDMFAGSGFDAGRDIAGIILNRWGHAYASPAPGFYFGKDGKPAPGDVLRAAPFARIAFANTDLSGTPDHKSSILEADRAVEQVLDLVLS